MPNRIYAYTVVGRDAEPWERIEGRERTTGTGLIKVGETTRRTARERIKQQLGTAYPNLEGVEILLDEPATRDDGTEFTDREVHAALVANGIKRPGGEWFEAMLDEVRAAINTVRSGIPFEPKRTDSYSMRPEQRQAVKRTAAYFRAHPGSDRPPKFLWNAKMRFGKTFTTYQLAKEMGWRRILVLTYKPAVESAWRDDLLRHVDFSGWHFVDRDTPIDEADELLSGADPVVRFASFQDLNGKSPDGQIKAHNESIHLTDWDCIVLDEYHFGAWRDSARDLYDPTDTAARRGRGARRRGHRGGPRSQLRALPLPVRHAVSSDHERRVHRGPDVQLDLCGRAGGEGGLGPQQRAEPLSRAAPNGDVRLRDGARGRGLGAGRRVLGVLAQRLLQGKANR